MILTLDIGNSATKAALFEGARLVRAAPLATLDEQGVRAFLGGACVAAAGLASVVPDRTPLAAAASGAATGREPLIVSANLRLPFAMQYRTPDTLGADRLAAAAGAAALFPNADAILAIDAGTAITLEVVASGAYRGGVIAPGPHLLRRALARGTAALPEVPAEMPASVIGTSTTDALRAGVMWGAIETVRGLIARTTEELGRQPVVVVTGGWAALLAQHLSVDHVEPHLVHIGIRRLMELNP